MKEIFKIKVTQINDRWHTRLILIEDDRVIDEMACDTRRNIGYCCFTMLRWADKLGWRSPMASAARSRNKNREPGKIWYSKNLGV